LKQLKDVESLIEETKKVMAGSESDSQDGEEGGEEVQ